MPEKPVLLTIHQSSVKTRSVIVKWVPRFEGNSPIRWFQLEYNRDSSLWQPYAHGSPPHFNIPPETREVEVKKLAPDTDYKFRVKAVNDKGPSPWSDYSRTVHTNKKGKIRQSISHLLTM